MRLIVVGAGASYGEGQALGLPEEKWPPIMKTAARYLWKDGMGFPNLIEQFLNSKGYFSENDPVDKFIQLEKTNSNVVNIEAYFKYLWDLKKDYPILRKKLIEKGYSALSLPEKWEDMWHDILTNAIGQPMLFKITTSMVTSQNDNMPPAVNAQIVAGLLKPGDAVISLNYDTIFETGLKRKNKKFKYLMEGSTRRDYSSILVSKIHGSLNLIFEKNRYGFSDLNYYGCFQTQEQKLFINIFPPREEKSYQQHPWANFNFNNLIKLKPHILTFWGVGFTESDYDLTRLYEHYMAHSKKIEIINPENSLKGSKLNYNNSKVIHHKTLDDWLRH